MKVPELRWEPSVFRDPLGGSIVLWPYLPCVRMPKHLRPRDWDGLALLSSSDELLSLKEEEKQEKESPGIHVESAAASGTTLGMLVRDLTELEVDGPFIPDPERIRLLRHAENSRGGMPIYSIEPGIGDSKWADWQSRWADEQVRMRNLLATMRRSSRWSKIRKMAINKVSSSKWIDPDLGAAATVCAAWWLEEVSSLTDELAQERDCRISSRLRGALADMRANKIGSLNEAGSPVLLAPVHQAYQSALENSLFGSDVVEEMREEP